MNRLFNIFILLAVFFSFSALYPQTIHKNDQDNKSNNAKHNSGKPLVRIENIDEQIKTINARLSQLEKTGGFYEKAIQSISSVSSSTANYFTFMSIMVTILSIVLPVISYIFVVKPYRELRVYKKKFKEEIPRIIDSNFEGYINNYEKRQSKKILSLLKEHDKHDYIRSHLFLSKYDQYDDEDYKNIIEYLNTKPEIDSLLLMMLCSIVMDIKSLRCEKFYKGILEADERTEYYKHAIKFFAKSNVSDYTNYLHKIIVASESGGSILIDLLQEIQEMYIGRDFTEASSAPKRIEGENKLKLLLNDENIAHLSLVKKFNSEPRTFFTPNRLNWFPVYSETLFYKKLVEVIENSSNS